MVSAIAEPSQDGIRIAVDARPLNHKFSGIGQYLFEILDHLLTEKTQTADEGAHQWMLYSDQPLEIPSHWRNVSTRTGTNSNRLLRAAKAQFQFGRWAVRDRATIYWSPRHQLPFILPNELPTVVTLHDLVFRLYPETMSRAGRWYDAWLTPKALERANSIITTSQAVNAELKSLYPRCTPKSCTIGLSSASAPVTANTRIRSRPYAIFCGSMEPRKNLDRFIRALANLNNTRDQPIELVIVSVIENNRSFIDYRPSVPAEEKAHLIQNATCLVLPSLYEGYGLPIAEAQRLGVPVLTSNRGAMREVAGEGGLFVDPTDEADIGQGLARLFDDPEMRQQLADNSGELGKRHSWSRSAQLTFDVLSKAQTS